MTDLPKLEIRSTDTMDFLKRVGYVRKGMKYPRFESHIFMAKTYLQYWRFMHQRYHRRGDFKRLARKTIAMQTFTGLRPEWVESAFK